MLSTFPKEVTMNAVQSLITISLTLVIIFAPQLIALHYSAKRESRSADRKYDYQSEE
jgi:hypothetical protein